MPSSCAPARPAPERSRWRSRRHALPEQERFSCATWRWARARHGCTVKEDATRSRLQEGLGEVDCFGARVLTRQEVTFLWYNDRMPNFNDTLKSWLANEGFASGSVNDDLVAYLNAQGFTGNINDLLFAFLHDQSGNINDRLALFRQSRRLSGNINDALKEFFQSR